LDNSNTDLLYGGGFTSTLHFIRMQLIFLGAEEKRKITWVQCSSVQEYHLMEMREAYVKFYKDYPNQGCL